MTVQDQIMQAMPERGKWYSLREIAEAAGITTKRAYNILYILYRKHYVDKDWSFHTIIYKRVKEVT